MAVTTTPTVRKRAVRILLECFLVNDNFYFGSVSHWCVLPDVNKNQQSTSETPLQIFLSYVKSLLEAIRSRFRISS